MHVYSFNKYNTFYEVKEASSYNTTISLTAGFCNALHLDDWLCRSNKIDMPKYD